MRKILVLVSMIFICVSLTAYTVSGESGIVSFDAADPGITIISPVAGDIFEPSDIAAIEFSILEDNFPANPSTPVVLEFYIDNEHHSEFDISFAAEPDGEYEYNWTVPDIISDNVYVKISATDYFGNIGTDESGSFIIRNLAADFEADITEGAAPLEVQFTDFSEGNITSWSWDFQNNGTIDSYEQNPIWTYEDAGIYSVSLTVYDAQGRASDTEIKVDYITVIEPIYSWEHSWVLHNFEDVNVGESGSAVLEITNTGNVPLTVDGYAGSSEYFSVEPAGFTIEPGASQELEIIFTPQEVSYYESQISWISEAGMLAVLVFGQGCEQSNPPELTYNGITGVTPEEGNVQTWFEFEVIYTDVDNDAPLAGYPQVGIDANGDGDFADPMEGWWILDEVDSSDDDYTDGKVYKLVTQLSYVAIYGYEFRAYDALGNLAIGEATEYAEGPEVSDDFLDISIYADDIGFSDNNPQVGDLVLIGATVHNSSSEAAEGFTVQIYANELLVSEQSVNGINGQGQVTLQTSYMFSEEGYYPIEVVIDSNNELEEINELNNSALRPLTVGEGFLPTAIDLIAELSPEVLITGHNLEISGSAEYTGQRWRDNEVMGGRVTVSIAELGIQQIVYTDNNGEYQCVISLDEEPGEYELDVSITDFTLSAEIEGLEFEIIAEPMPVPGLPDIYIPGLNVSYGSDCLVVNDLITISFPVGNRGDAGAGSFHVGAFIDGMFCSEIEIDSLAAGVTSFVSMEIFSSELGEHSLYVNADYLDEVRESGAANNGIPSVFSLHEGGADLTVYDTELSDPLPMAGRAFDLTVEVINQNCTASDFSRVAVFIEETELASAEINPLVYEQSQTVVLENIIWLEAGDFELIVEVDPDDVVEESDENNQVRIIPLEFSEQYADIKVENILLSNTDPEVGSELSFFAVLLNQGFSATGEFMVYFVIDGNLIGGVTVEDLTAGESIAVESENWIYDGELNYLTVTADAAGLVNELNTVNNTMELAVCSDLEVTLEFTYPGNGELEEDRLRILPGIPAVLNCQVINNGCIAAHDVEIGYGVLEEEFGIDIIPEITAGGIMPSTIVTMFFEPDTLDIMITADAENEILENDESNNSSLLYARVTELLPDLMIESQNIAPSSLNPVIGEEVSVIATVINSGFGATDDFYVRLSVDDVILQDTVYCEGLLVDEHRSIEFSELFIPQAAGIYEFMVEVDITENMEESSETNNIATRAVICGSSADLCFAENGLVLSTLLPETGDNMQITANLVNNGAAAAEADVEFYIESEGNSFYLGSETIEVAGLSAASVEEYWEVTSETGLVRAVISGCVPLEYDLENNEIECEFGEMLAQVSDLPMIEFAEDEEYNLELESYFANIDETSLIYSVISHIPEITAYVNSTGLHVSSEENWYGEGSLTLQVMNQYYQELFCTIEVNVLAVNDAPVLDLPDNIEFEEDSSYAMDLADYAWDIEGDELSFYAAGNENIFCELAGETLIVYAAENWYGTGSVEISVSDDVTRLTTSAELEVIVLGVNDAPEVLLPENITFAEDNSLVINFSQYCSDVDGDELLYSVEVGANISEDIIGEDELMLTAEANWNGNSWLRIFASDNMSRLVGIDSTQVIVTPVNDAPMIDLPAEVIYFEEDSSVEYDLNPYVWDIDGDELEISIVDEEILLTGSNDLVMTLSALPDWFGSSWVNIFVSDNQNRLIASDSILVEVEQLFDDDPYLEFTEDIILQEDIESIVDFSEYIQNQDNFLCELGIEGAGHIFINIDGFDISLQGVTNWYGSEDVIFILTDPDNGNIYSQEAVTIIVEPVNDPPALSFPGVCAFYEDEPYSINYWDYITDVDNETLSIVAGDGENITSELTDSLLTFVPEENWFGDNYIMISVSDDLVRDTTTTYMHVIVQSVNDSPQAVTDEEITADEGSEIVLDGSGSFDVDDDELTFFWDVPEDWEIEDATAEIADVTLPYVLEDTVVEVILTVQDEAGLESEAQLTVNINDYVDFNPDVILKVTRLTGVYPNPFNPSTTISYQLAETEKVNIEVYNIKGQKESTLFDQEQDAGNYEICWQADDKPSGVYMLRFIAGDCNQKYKVLLLK